MRNILFIAKTNLNNDGRILNEMTLLEDGIKDVQIDFVLLPDKPTQIELGGFVRLHEVKLKFRHSKLLRPLTVLEFTLRSLVMMLRLKPDVVHVQDTAVVPPALLFSFLRPKVHLIYDDHEIPNENENLGKKFLDRLEVWLMKRANFVIHANQERMEVINKQHNVKTPSTYFLNLPYFEDASVKPDPDSMKMLTEVDKQIADGTKFIMHQGVIVKERGSEKLAHFAMQLPDGYQILLLGGNRAGYDKFLSETNAPANKFLFVGSVNYTVLPLFWDRVVASVIMYLPTYINNRFCAPNRFYLSIQKGVPVIVNKSNPVLKNFVDNFNCGFFIEDVTTTDLMDISMRFDSDSLKKKFDSLRKNQMDEFVRVYKKLTA